MRRIIFAPSFDQEAEDIGVYIEERFGEAARRDFVIELSAVCIRLATLPASAPSNMDTRRRAPVSLSARTGFSSTTTTMR